MKIKWFDDLIEILYPHTCVACGNVLMESEENLCIKCLISLPKVENEDFLQLKLQGKLKVRKIISLWQFAKKSKVQHVLHALKYKNKPELGIYLGKLLGSEIERKKQLYEPIDLIIGVPLHKSKLKQRGYNQADKIAEGLAEVLQVEFKENVLVKMAATECQTKKSRIDRFKNTDQIFDIQDINCVKYKNIALVDDVLTTGATIEACGALLLDAGCKNLYIITIASAK